MILFFVIIIAIIAFIVIKKHKYQELEEAILKELGFKNWNIVSYWDDEVVVKSRQALEKYDEVKFFKENREKLAYAESIIKKKRIVSATIKDFLESNEDVGMVSPEIRFPDGRLQILGKRNPSPVFLAASRMR